MFQRVHCIFYEFAIVEHAVGYRLQESKAIDLAALYRGAYNDLRRGGYDRETS